MCPRGDLNSRWSGHIGQHAEPRNIVLSCRNTRRKPSPATTGSRRIHPRKWHAKWQCDSDRLDRHPHGSAIVSAIRVSPTQACLNSTFAVATAVPLLPIDSSDARRVDSSIRSTNNRGSAESSAAPGTQNVSQCIDMRASEGGTSPQHLDSDTARSLDTRVIISTDGVHGCLMPTRSE
jgi:hypothetical protein